MKVGDYLNMLAQDLFQPSASLRAGCNAYNGHGNNELGGVSTLSQPPGWLQPANLSYMRKYQSVSTLSQPPGWLQRYRS